MSDHLHRIYTQALYRDLLQLDNSTPDPHRGSMPPGYKSRLQTFYALLKAIWIFFCNYAFLQAITPPDMVQGYSYAIIQACKQIGSRTRPYKRLQAIIDQIHGEQLKRPYKPMERLQGI